jgi:hypothetical protein
VGGLLRTGTIIICGLALALPAAAGRADTPALTAIVGTNDGFNITLNDASGKKVSRLAPGTYTVVVQDRSTLHNFHLASNEDPTVDFRTDLDFVRLLRPPRRWSGNSAPSSSPVARWYSAGLPYPPGATG